ncbi:MAG: hypothetical protein BWY42_00841 [Candidatus Omnitrophica bacterium ADurb.Bin277]|nr:MAG: hypothetical protein BWY42_00841 [Candidatus Omnitrophica bacterium ADurb.Bin277]
MKTGVDRLHDSCFFFFSREFGFCRYLGQGILRLRQFRQRNLKEFKTFVRLVQCRLGFSVRFSGGVKLLPRPFGNAPRGHPFFFGLFLQLLESLVGLLFPCLFRIDISREKPFTFRQVFP